MRLVAALDVGTTGVKCLVVDPASGPVATAYVEHRPNRPAPDRVEQHPALIAAGIELAIRRALRGSRAYGTVAALAVTGARATFVCLDRAGLPATPFVIWQDQRGGDICTAVASRFGAARSFNRSGLPLGPIASASKLRWFADHEPATWARVDRVATAPGFALLALGADASVTTPSAAAYVGLLDARLRTWSDELLAAFGLASSVLPAIVAEGTTVGFVSPQVAERTGLPAGTPLVAAPSDWASTLAGCGALETGEAAAYLGTGGALGAIVDRPILDEAAGLSCLPASTEGRYALEGLLVTGAAPYRWLRDLLVDRVRERGSVGYARLARLARASRTGSRGVVALPAFAGLGAPEPDPLARAAYAGIGLDTRPGDLVRATIEGVALDLRALLDVVGQIAAPVRRLALTGPPAASPLWSQVVADALEVVVDTVHPADPTALGAAAVAVVGLDGVDPTTDPPAHARAVRAAVRRMTTRARSYRPRPADVAVLAEVREIRAALARQLRDGGIHERLAAVRNGRTPFRSPHQPDPSPPPERHTEERP
ncbi:MAG TPA: FGGY family carbohydrate kinase [Candidatus Limnocylindrales bacterium]|nr:FGGY family carbohydrate kinase [Candidatus Limnocylindrales bacterium]